MPAFRGCEGGMARVRPGAAHIDRAQCCVLIGACPAAARSGVRKVEEIGALRCATCRRWLLGGHLLLGEVAGAAATTQRDDRRCVCSAGNNPTRCRSRSSPVLRSAGKQALALRDVLPPCVAQLLFVERTSREGYVGSPASRCVCVDAAPRQRRCTCTKAELRGSLMRSRPHR